MEIVLKENESIEDLQLKGLKIIQNKKWFCFGVDSVFLSDFYDLKKSAQVVDLGTGTGIVPILLYGKKKIHKITGVEIQQEVAQMAQRSVLMNDLTQYIDIKNFDLREWENHLPKNNYDAVTANPPYVKFKAGIINPEDKKAISRHEIHCKLEDIISAASGLLKHNGAFFMVHRPERLVDIFYLMRQARVEPKKVRFVYSRKGKKASLVLIKGVKYANNGLKFVEPIYVYGDDGGYTDEIFEIYNIRRENI